MNKIKIIDLLNKIANGEEVPKRIKYQNEIYTYANDDYCTTNEKWLFSVSYTEGVAWLNDFLNTEVEIEIEKLNLETDKLRGKEIVRSIDYLLEGKINELIDVVNELKRDKE